MLTIRDLDGVAELQVLHLVGVDLELRGDDRDTDGPVTIRISIVGWPINKQGLTSTCG